MLDYQENKQEEGLENAFLKGVFTLEIIPIQGVYFILSFKKLGLVTSAGVSGGLREVSLKGQNLSRATKWVARLFYFLEGGHRKKRKNLNFLNHSQVTAALQK